MLSGTILPYLPQNQNQLKNVHYHQFLFFQNGTPLLLVSTIKKEDEEEIRGVRARSEGAKLPL